MFEFKNNPLPLFLIGLITLCTFTADEIFSQSKTTGEYEIRVELDDRMTHFRDALQYIHQDNLHSLH